MLAAHADWSVDPRKRWMAVARRRRGRWHLAVPCPVGDPASLIGRLLDQAGGEPVFLGLDAPIGLPRAYVAAHAASFAPAWVDFPHFLRGLAGRPDFFRVCDTLAELHAGRPFYPHRARPGMTRAAHAAALGLPGPDRLMRLCDRATIARPAGAPPFWTLGANQSGKAAISVWRDVLLPALSGTAPPALWPFDGAVSALLGPGRAVLAETYPAEALRQLGLPRIGSKRHQADRVALGGPLLGSMRDAAAEPDPALREAVCTGFGADAAGEDRLDCVLGLLCALSVLDGRRRDTVPPDPWVTRWEGWVLGQDAPPNGRAATADSACATNAAVDS